MDVDNYLGKRTELQLQIIKEINYRREASLFKFSAQDIAKTMKTGTKELGGGFTALSQKNKEAEPLILAAGVKIVVDGSRRDRIQLWRINPAAPWDEIGSKIAQYCSN
ncbi:hypothetical protein COX64_02340 [Candidatus Dojkabacteria bacterium CG_4_10_14_0_2_um_filter_Dojkabacteria_WS6_41_15]|uniref:Uncharacterized protein n=1 Tax=Candidatus Dojkabacteria bacterium CG_4_10_14_0_2_um_filter_Dojkabacteria_WS6_41_15 TaxID=2014249 RepID=A0A2M7W2W4_9BACT|nr:MAG: hypothetical protein COX64_02340 [Candidatus Dojkabacteria bacterium CG_4_10_14_0_2_um_filter_Dojkabacteria_WS6_41_15]